MKDFIRMMAVAALVFGCLNFSFAQDDNDDMHDINITIPEVALLDIEPSANTTISLGAIAPTEAGDPIDFSATTDNTLWINYSSIIGSTTEPSRKVTAKYSGTLPGGMLLKVNAAADAGNGAGNVGTPVGQITLTTSDQDFVTTIGSCYTNTPENNGHQLTYVLEVDPGNYGDIDFDDATTLTVIYTLTDN